MEERRRCIRVKVPENTISCQIVQPSGIAGTGSLLVDDINMDGLSFISGQKIDETALNLAVSFYFNNPMEIENVWARVAYCNRLLGEEKYKVGVAFTGRRDS